MNISEYDRLDLMAERTDIDTFMAAVREAQANKDHICIDIVTMKESTDYTAVINSVNADNIQYIEKTKCVNVGGWRDPYNLTVPGTWDMFVEDTTSSYPGYKGMIMQYTFRMGRLSIAFLFQYDERYIDKML